MNNKISKPEQRRARLTTTTSYLVTSENFATEKEDSEKVCLETEGKLGV